MTVRHNILKPALSRGETQAGHHGGPGPASRLTVAVKSIRYVARGPRQQG